MKPEQACVHAKFMEKSQQQKKDIENFHNHCNFIYFKLLYFDI